MFEINEQAAFEVIEKAMRNENIPVEDRQRIQEELKTQSQQI